MLNTIRCDNLATNIVEQLLQQHAIAVSDAEMAGFKPAVLCLYEWDSYWLELPGVDALIVGTTKQKPDHGDWFLLKFKNQLGLAKLQPMHYEKSASKPIFVEVISGKFSTPQKHLEFYTTLLDELFHQVARLPFTYQAPTGRSVVEALRPPTPLFTYHFLKHHGMELRSALTIILAAPHRLLIDEEVFVPLALASGVGPDAILDMIQRSSQWEKANNHPLAKRLGGFVPTRIMQQLPEETFDTPENRFILNFLHTLQSAIGNLLTQPWWKYVPVSDQQVIVETHSQFQQAVLHPVFEEVGEQHLLPMNSQVLLRKEGYRQMLTLWQKFQQARRPLFEPLQQAIELRNVATLYEFWVFFVLVEKIGYIFNTKPVLQLKTSDINGLNWSSRALFGEHGMLIYNQGFQHNYNNFHSNSTAMRPDYTWQMAGKAYVIFDAKFSLSTQDVATVAELPKDGLAVGPSLEENLITRPSLDNLYRMHTYRDALDLQAAVILYPGNTSVFFDRQRGKLSQFELKDCLTGDLSGIGAIPLKPGFKFEK